MKAIVYREYGSADVLKLEEVSKPAPKDNEVLIKVRAAAVNPLDWHFMRGVPGFVRLFAGLRKPKKTRLGVDVAGDVELVGTAVEGFKPGDSVFGMAEGAFAEYVCAPVSAIVVKPQNMNYEQAAAVPIGGLTALQALRDKAKLQSGQKVLINGASGGVGTFAVQISKWMGAKVTGICSTRNVELVRGIGAERVIDYTREGFTASVERYDAIFDLVGNRPLGCVPECPESQGSLYRLRWRRSGNAGESPAGGHDRTARGGVVYAPAPGRDFGKRKQRRPGNSEQADDDRRCHSGS